MMQRIARDGRRPGENTLLGSATIRSLIGWFLALGTILIVANTPIVDGNAGLSWRSVQRNEPINLVPQPEEILEKRDIEGGLITKFSQEVEEVKPEESAEEEGAEEGEKLPEPESRVAKLERIEREPVLDFAEQGPAIVGGLGTLYLNIDYPASARNNGVQGLSVLEFVVEKDGTTSDIQIMKSLHPACDSAAVAAVTRTLFKPGRQNGEIVRVKMRLPIRFKLVNPLGADTLGVQRGS